MYPLGTEHQTENIESYQEYHKNKEITGEIASIDVRYGILWQKVESRNGKDDA
jgi:hypothetical protein